MASSCSSYGKRLGSPSVGLHDIPQDVQLLIFDKLIFLSDFIKVGAVCKQWHSVYLGAKEHRMQRCQEAPILLISKNNHLFSLYENKFYSSMVKIPDNVRLLHSSSYGWLAVHNEDSSITLLNPFSHNTVDLPVYKTMNDIRKVIFSCNPNLYFDTCVKVHMIDGCSLGTIMSGDKSWTVRKISDGYPEFSDILYYKGKLCIVDFHGKLWVEVEPNEQTFKLVVEIEFSRVYRQWSCNYLVESSKGELLLVSKFPEQGSWFYSFKVFKLKETIWEEIHRLNDDEALFIGENGGLCILASRFPNVQPDCIYSVVSHNLWGQVYCMSDKSVAIHKGLGCGNWIFPTLY